MNYALVTTMSVGLLLISFSCKEEKQEIIIDKVEVEVPAKKPEVSELSPEEKRLKTANKELGWIMQDMEVPEYKLEKLHKKGEFLSEDYLKYSADIIKNAQKFNKLDHPDEKLVGFAKDMLKAMSAFESAVASKNVEEIKTNWEALTKTCAACHKDYKKGGGGY
ncbi:MAG: cytochrome c [Lentisphaeraceae bacterium]|nr:cytochrome c [Lentisphaeraceae bacterium]